jgi:hypothetical protein
MRAPAARYVRATLAACGRNNYTEIDVMKLVSWFRPLVCTSALAFAALTGSAATAGDDREGVRHVEVVRFDIAENGHRFSFDARPLHPNGSPAYGNEFITEGYIYLPNTLDNSSRGVNPDGSPEFPDRVIGRWSARGWHVGNGGLTTEGPWVVTTQVFDFGPSVGIRSVITDGYETPEINVAIKRAITGGTGKYVAAKGEQTQWMLRFPNPTFGLNARIELRIQK